MRRGASISPCCPHSVTIFDRIFVSFRLLNVVHATCKPSCALEICYPSIRSMGGILNLLRVFFWFFFVRVYSFLRLDFTNRPEIWH